MDIGITAIGTANPPFVQTQEFIADFLIEKMQLNSRDARLLKTIYRASGITTRYSVIQDYVEHVNSGFFPTDVSQEFPSTKKRMQIFKQHALALAASATKPIWSQHAKDSITHLITVSCTGLYAPGLDIELIANLALKTTTKRSAINFMGCYGVFNALRLAASICAGDAHAKVLIVSVELCSIHFQPGLDRDTLVANALFADGAGALLIENYKSTTRALSLKNFLCDILPQSELAMAWSIGQQGFDIVLSSYVPDMIKQGIEQFFLKLLNSANLSPENIGIWAIHPGGIKILKACETALKIKPAANQHAYEVLAKYGNMSSATIIFVLKSIWSTLEPQHHQQNVFSCAFGPGLTLESTLMEVNYA
jgi:alpha-pyrone synthase